MATVELNSIRKEWASAVALHGIDLKIADGEFIAVLGPSGCGKSTTLFILAGIYLPTSGDLLFDGARVNEVEARERNVGIVFQSYALYPNMTVLENIMFPLRFQRLPKREAKRKAEDAAALVQVEALLARRPSELSGGQQQRVALARALVKEPHLLLLDEPLSNLDATLRLSMRSEIKRIQRRLNVTTVLVTHDQIEATTMADRIVVMNQGRIEQIGTPDDLYERPATRFVAGFVGSPPMNILPTDRASANNITLSGVNGAAAKDFGVRPEHIRYGEEGLPATATGIEPLGRETLTHFETPIGPVHVLEAGNGSVLEGERTALSWQPQHALLFGEDGRRIADGSASASLPPSTA